ncbi:MAG: DUF1318 domain-containing protein [Candidatus Omnitrophica bacterium]|nr:DUF1318 domain-containing protein [Candidatus Omnitrophota bacterium]
MKKPNAPAVIASAFALWVQMIGSPLWAATYDLREYTPEVQAAISGRQARYQQLASAKAQGSVGENKDGGVTQLGGGPDVTAWVASENQDRRVIYKAIVQQNNLPADALPTVEQVFAEVQRNKAAPGDSIQLPSGEWVKK